MSSAKKESYWLMGESSVSKVKKLKRAYIKNRVDSAEKRYNRKFKNYHPLMGVRQEYEFLRGADIEALSAAHIPFDFKPELQSRRAKIYHQLPFLNWFQSGVMTINEKILDENPSCESEFKEALNLISAACPWMYENFRIAIYEICPVSKRGESRFIGGSSDNHLIGTVFTSLKPGDFPIFELSISIAHELGHNVLMLYEAGQEIVGDEDRESMVYSAIRKTARPVYGSFHACVALAYMAALSEGVAKCSDFSEEVREEANKRGQQNREDLGVGLKALIGVSLNPIGEAIFNELKSYSDT